MTIIIKYDKYYHKTFQQVKFKSRPNWWHICIFINTQAQIKNAKEPPANA
jgi:hypothetical protein